MKTIFALLTLLFSVISYAEVPKLTCLITVNDEKTIEIKPQLEDIRTGFFEFMDGYYSDNHIKISYYPGFETVILKVYDKNADKTYLKDPSPALAGKYNLVVEEDAGIFGNQNLRKLEISCDLKL